MDNPDDIPNGEKFVDSPDEDSPSPSKSNPPGAGGAASKMPRSCIAAPPSSVMNVDAGFGAVFSETGGGGGGFDRLSSVRSIAALRLAMASTLAWRAAKAALRASAFTASSEALQASKSFRDSFDASFSPRASKHLAHLSWAFAYVPSASAELIALLSAWA